MGWCIGCQRKWSARSGWGIGSGGMLIGGRRRFAAPPPKLGPPVLGGGPGGGGVGGGGFFLGGGLFSPAPPQHLAAGEIRLIFWFWLESPCIRRG